MFSQFSFLDINTPGTLWPFITVVLKSCTIRKMYCHCRLPLLLPTVAARKEKLSPTLHTGRWRHTSHSQLIPIFSSLRSWVLSYIQKVIKVDLFNFWFDKSWVQFIHLTKHKSQSHCYVVCKKLVNFFKWHKRSTKWPPLNRVNAFISMVYGERYI